jgi:hypothetical protein
VFRIAISWLLAVNVVLATPPSDACAQEPEAVPWVEIVAGPSRFLANTANWGVHLGATWFIPTKVRQLSLGALAFYGPARGDSTSPAVSSIGFEFALAVRPVKRTAMVNVLLTFGVARTHFDASRQEAALADCNPLEGCFAEGVRYPSGARFTWGPGIALDLPLMSTFSLRTHGRVLLTGDDPTWGTKAVYRLDVGLTWRP